MSAKKLKILCFHGYRQNSNIFKSKCGGFRKLFKNRAEFFFIDAPHLIPHESVNETEDGHEFTGLGWWFSGEAPDYFHSAHESQISKGFEESILLIKNTFESTGPFDGILGFSMGASLVSLLCVLKQLNEINLNFRFAILVAGFKSLSSPHLSLFEKLNGKLIEIPSLHIIGETDRVIAKEKSQQLTQYFLSPDIIYHSGGHLIPSSSTHRKECNDFFDKFLE